MWFAIGFAAACGVCAYFWVTEGLFLRAAAFAGMFLLLLLAGRWAKWLRKATVLCLGIAVGLGWFQLYADHYLNRAIMVDGLVADVTARCTDYSYQTPYGTGVEGVLYLDGRPFRAKFYVSGEIDMEPGDVLTGAFRLEVTTPEGDGQSSYNQGEGLFLIGYQEEDGELLKLAEAPAWAFPAMLRQKMLNILDSVFPEDTAPFAKALLLGDRSDLDYRTNTDFRVTGIMHVIAVSGLHVSILFSLIYILGLKQRFLVALLGIPALILFSALAGFSPSVVRASLMQCLMILAMLLDRDYDGPTELAFSCMVMLILNPLAITSISLQLSVGCMAGIFLFQKPLDAWLKEKIAIPFPKFRRWLAGSVSVTLSAMALTTPFVAMYFGAVSLVGVLTNLLVLGAVTLIFYGVLLVCLTGFFWPTVCSGIAGGISWLIRYVLGVSRLLASFPLAAVYTRSVYVIAWLVLCYLLLAVFLLSRKKRPDILLPCVAIGLCLSLAASWVEPHASGCRISVLDVGQGQCILLQSEEKTYMVDCGGSYDQDAADIAADTLLSQGVFRLDGIILTHFDSDHSGGIPYLLERIPSDIIFIPEAQDDNGITEKLPENVVRVQEDLLLTYGTTKLTIYGPVVPNSSNESSLAVLFQSENCDILITGDRSVFAERMLLRTAQLPKLEILVAGHHGAKNATGEALLEATRPNILAISVGKNRFGHPSQEVLDRAALIGAEVYRTDIHGNLIFRR